MTEKYNVEAVAQWGFSADGRVLDHQFVTVRVMDSQGDPVSGLKKANFTITELGSFFSGKTIKLCLALEDIGLEGCYSLKVDSGIRLKGQFSYAVIVSVKGRGRTQSGGGKGIALFDIVKLH